MKIKTELIKGYIADIVCSQMVDFEIDEEKIADTQAIKALGEIQKVLMRDNELDDFLIVEEIVNIFSKYEIDFGACHDF